MPARDVLIGVAGAALGIGLVVLLGGCSAATPQAPPAGGEGDALLHAVRANNLWQVARLLAAGVDPDAPAENPPIFPAAINPDPRILSLLLEAGASPNVVCYEDDASPLHLAAWQGNRRSISLLVEHGADPQAVNAPGQSVLAFAALGGEPAAVEELVEAGAHLAEPGSLPDAAAHGETERVEQLLSEGMSPNVTVEDGLTALHCAVGRGDADLGHRLLSAGADPNAAKDNGWSVMHAAAHHGDPELIRLLVEAGARVGDSTDGGLAPLGAAVWRGRTEAVRALLEAGADVAGGPRSGTPLHLAANFGHLDIAEQLLAAGADPNATNDFGRTPLHQAAAGGEPEVGRLLVEAGAEPLADTDGNTPLHVAISCCWPCPPTLELLYQAGVDVNAQDDHGATALHTAVAFRRKSDVEWLLKHGARTDLKEKWGRTPLDLARHAHHEGIEKLLRKHAAAKQ